jgi:hypothetical protein
MINNILNAFIYTMNKIREESFPFDLWGVIKLLHCL